jgi:hypothetical protein
MPFTLSPVSLIRLADDERSRRVYIAEHATIIILNKIQYGEKNI